MVFRSRRTVAYVTFVVVTTAALAALYNYGMATWENRPQPLYRSFEVVIQSFTTTGYGEDAPWRTPQMNVLAVVMQLTGIGFILTAVDVFAVPWLREALTPSAPETAPDLRNHVVVCGYTPRTEAFVAELRARDREYVFVVADDDRARELDESGFRVVHGDPESTATLVNVAIGSAVALVADVADDTNASIALAARDAAPDVRVITLVEDAELVRYHRAAGADEVLSPRQLLGRSLAEEVSTAVTTTVEDGVVIGDDFELVEFTVAEGSDLRARRFDEIGLRDRFGVSVIGAWIDGTFETPVPPGTGIDAGTRLLVAGESEQVNGLRVATSSTVRNVTSRRVILAGYGDSGRAAAETLSRTGAEVTVLDVEEADGVDVVGDARDPEVLTASGIGSAATLLLAVGDDTTAVFATLIARELNPDLQIVVRANEEDAVRKLYRAGADYVQSLPTVSGRMLVSTTFEDAEMLAYDTRISVVRLPAAGLAGTTLVDAEVRTETGCTVVAVNRDGGTITDFDPGTFTFAEDDEVVVAGTDEAITRFENRFVG
jgi:Trk K+ transport system NAD-binding subunit